MTGPDAVGAAEQAALTEMLKSRLVNAVGELGAAAHQRAEAVAATDSARLRADELVEIARRQGRELVDAADESAREALVTYESAYRSALEVGWTADELARIGFLPVPVPVPAPDASPAAAGTPGPVAGRSRSGAAGRRGGAGDPAGEDASLGVARVSFSGRSTDRPPWPPISPRRTRPDEPPDRAEPEPRSDQGQGRAG